MNYLRVGGKFKLSKKLGEGTFGTLYSGFNMQTKEEVASSTQQANQSVDGRNDSGAGVLRNEVVDGV